MWSSVTERRTGTAGVNSSDAERLVRRQAVQRVEDGLDQRADLGSRNGVVADMRRHDLGSEGEKLTALDALVVGHPGPLRLSLCRTGEVIGSHLRLQVLHEQY